MTSLLLFLSLILSFDAACFTGADEALLRSAGILNNKVLLHDDSWSIKPTEIDIDGVVYKGQGKSLIKWNELNHSSWLDYNQWLSERKRRDKMPDWKIRLRQSTHEEKFGEIISCVGYCQIFRGDRKILVSAGSRLYEGDEFQTTNETSAWILLVDGTLVRVSAKTSITLNEINISKKRTYAILRLNHGHVKTQRRAKGKFAFKNLAETDSSFYPLKILKANREYFSRLEFQKLEHDDRQVYLTKKNLGHYSQYRYLNESLAKDESLNKINNELFIYSPNATLKVSNADTDFFYGVNSKSYIRVIEKPEHFRLEDSRESKANLMLRGYRNNKMSSLRLNQWYTVDKTGKQLSEDDLTEKFQTIDLLVKRVPTIQVAREIVMAERYFKLYQEDLDSKSLATNFGYRLWDIEDSEIDKREKFLFEYTRRVETTNLSSLNKIFEKDKEDFDRSFYEFAFSGYLRKLKGMYANKRLIIPELSDTEYYIWVLKYAKK